MRKRKTTPKTVTSLSSPARDDPETNVLLRKSEIKMLMQMVQKTPIQGNLESMPQVLSKLVSLQEKLAASLKNLEQKKE